MSQAIYLIPSSGPGSGTVTSISAGTGITLTPNPITTTGSVALDTTNLTTTDGTIYWTGSALATTATGSSGQILTSNGVGVAPSYQNAASTSISITGNFGGPLVGTAFTFTGAGTGLIFSGSGSTQSLSGTVNIASGGTNATSFAHTDGTIYYDGTSLVATATGSAGQILTSNGVGVAPSYQNAGAAGITTINGDSGSVTPSAGAVSIISNVGSFNSGASVNFSGSGSTLTLNVTDASRNTFIGHGSGAAGVSGDDNTALGQQSLASISAGSQNTCIGTFAGGLLSGANSNTFIGASCAESAVNGDTNTGVGYNALSGLYTGSATNNTAIGASAGQNYNGAESNNIVIGAPGTTGESGVIRLGSSGTQTTTFIVGINGVTTSFPMTMPVLIDGNDQLGTITSSARFKRDIQDMGDASCPIMKLRPVTFNYKSHEQDFMQYGLIAEEVYEIFPHIVNLDEEGKPFTVRYHDMSMMFLNELQKVRKELDELKSVMASR